MRKFPIKLDFFHQGECELQGYQGQDCGNIHIDEELRDKYGNYYMFSKEENNLVQIRRFISDKLLVYEPDKYLGNFECFEDGLTKLGKEVCADALDEYRAVSKWRIDPCKNTSNFASSHSLSRKINILI